VERSNPSGDVESFHHWIHEFTECFVGPRGPKPPVQPTLVRVGGVWGAIRADGAETRYRLKMSMVSRWIVSNEDATGPSPACAKSYRRSCVNRENGVCNLPSYVDLCFPNDHGGGAFDINLNGPAWSFVRFVQDAVGWLVVLRFTVPTIVPDAVSPT
jgi:hypothetical protein